jgi:hypothetical protein
MRFAPCSALLLLAAGPLAAQSSKDLTRAAATITEADVRARINIIADDSMMGRDTPSPGLEMTAAYVASQFKKAGLKPAGDSGTYFQRFPLVRRRLLAARSELRFTSADGVEIILPFATSAAQLGRGSGATEKSGGVTLLGGTLDPAALRPDDLKGRFVVMALDLDHLPANIDALAGAIIQAGASAIVVVTPDDSAGFAGRLARQERVRVSRAGPAEGPGGPLIVQVRESDIVAQAPQASQTFEQMRAAVAPLVQVLPDWQGSAVVTDTALGETSAPNVVALLEGRDKSLRGSYVVYSAHMDHVGITPGLPDSINNGADDDASGTVGVIEMAEAFSRPGARPKRSVLFITVSGEEKGLWGSDYFVTHPTVPLKDMVADLNMDMIGRNWPDTIVAIGREHSDLGQTLATVNAAHPELGMTAIDDRWPEENFYFRSDHFNFAKNGVPILFFFNGVHADYHQVSDSPDKIESDKESRIIKLLFYLGQAVANAPMRPQWNPDSYAKIVQPPKVAS